MPGQALISIGSKQWTVSLATTLQELAQGLGGLSSIPAGTGMLFDMGFEQIITVTTVPMLFSIDVVFITGSLAVVDIALDIPPEKLVVSEVPARYFLEVNAGEAAQMKAGDQVVVQLLSSPAPDNTLVDFAVALLTAGLLLGSARVVTKAAFSGARQRLSQREKGLIEEAVW